MSPVSSTSTKPRVEAKPKVFVTGPIRGVVAQFLQQFASVKVHESPEPPTPSELRAELSNVDGVFCMLSCRVNGRAIADAERLRVISNMAVGYDNIDVRAATERGVIVTNTPGVLTETTADLAFGLIIAVARRMVEGDRTLRTGGWKRAWDPEFMIGTDVHGKTLGIVGLGRIGEAIARRARGFCMHVVYAARTRKPTLEAKLRVRHVDLDSLLREADFITLNVPLTAETHHLIGEKQLRLMKPSAFLINTSRGPVVDEKALVKALRMRLIAGAALDVYEKEPIGPSHPLTKLDNVVLTPHVGSATDETRMKMALLTAENLKEALAGRVPRNIVNPEVMQRSRGGLG